MVGVVGLPVEKNVVGFGVQVFHIMKPPISIFIKSFIPLTQSVRIQIDMDALIIFCLRLLY